jgi:hypothetical protein
MDRDHILTELELAVVRLREYHRLFNTITKKEKEIRLKLILEGFEVAMDHLDAYHGKEEEV